MSTRHGANPYLAVLVAVGVFLVPRSLEAATITFNTSDSQIDAGVDNQGWWSATASNATSNPNYAVGQNAGALVRNFFSFDLSSLDLSSQVITSATLEVVQYSFFGDATETLRLSDVSTDVFVLNNNTGTSAAIYADLGSGVSYGDFVVPAYAFSNTQLLSFSLNAAALADITSAAGGWFSIGGSLLSISGGGTQILTGNSGSAGIQRLVIETTTPVPEPATLLLLGTGLGAVAARRRLKKRV